MTVYYFSSTSGAANHTGTQEGSAWNSFTKLKNIKLQAGDEIRLEAGSVFKESLNLTNFSGSADLPIKITSYGSGPTPIFTPVSGGGIYASKADYVVVENVAFNNAGGIVGRDSDHWVMRNVTFNYAGGTNYSGAINWRGGEDLLIENNTLLNSKGDGIFMLDVKGVVVKDNIIAGVMGTSADNIQIHGNNVVLDHNMLSFGENSTSTKGNVVFQGDGLYAHDNYLEGGGYGISMSGDHAVIEGNTIVDHMKYSWSMGIGIGAEAGVLSEGIIIRDNDLSGAPNAISFYGAKGLTVEDLEITGNRFHDWTSKAIKFTNTELHGSYTDNVYYQSYDENISNSFAGSNKAGLVMANNAFDNPDAVTGIAEKIVTIRASASLCEGAPIMRVYQNDKLVFETEVSAQKSLGHSSVFSFALSEYDVTDKLKITYANDKQNKLTKEDRNLYVHDIDVNDANVSFWDAQFSGKVYTSKVRDLISFTSTSSITFNGEDAHLERDDAAIISKPDTLLDWGDVLERHLSENHIIGASNTLTQDNRLDDLKTILTDLDQLLGANFSIL